MNAEFERVELPLAEPFGIARGTTATAENVLVRVRHDGHTGVGAAAPSRRYGETADTVGAVLPDLLSVVEDLGDPHRLGRAERRLRATVRDNPAARAGVAVALQDLVGRLAGEPLYRRWGLDPARAPDTSFTVGLAETDEMARKAAAVEAGHSILKVKLGTDRDRAIVRAVREAAPDARIRVDANEAWGKREAVAKTEFLADRGVEFVEQPVPADEPDALRFVHDRSPLPVAADESVRTADDVPRVADRADVVVVKLMKCGGVRAAKRAIATAHAHGLEVMLGCMVESSAAIAAAAHLSPLVEYADLDGSLLLAEDPYEGPVRPDGSIDLAGGDRPGTGAREREGG